MSEWPRLTLRQPRLTLRQRETLLEMETAKWGCLKLSGRLLVTAWALQAKGLIVGGAGNIYELTQRGKDYLRFGPRWKPKRQPPTIRSLVREWLHGTCVGEPACGHYSCERERKLAAQLAALLDAHYAFLETEAKVSSNFSRVKAIKEMCESVLGKPEGGE